MVRLAIPRVLCPRAPWSASGHLGRCCPRLIASTRPTHSFFRPLHDEPHIQGEPRSVIKLRVSNDELQRALGGRRTAPSPPVPPTDEPSSSPPSTSPSPSLAVHPTVASHSRSDVLATDPDTLRALANAGHPFAQHYIGVLLMTGSEGLPLDRAQAAHYLHSSIQHEQPHLEPLSLFFLAGLIDEQSRHDTEQQQQQQQQPGQQQTAVNQPTSASLPPDLPSPLSLYMRFCEMSDPSSPFFHESQFRAARAMLNHDGGSDSDHVVGVEWMERAALGGQTEAMLHVARQRLDSASKRVATDAAGRQAAARDEQEAQEWMQTAKKALEQQLQQETRTNLGNATQSAHAAPSNRTTASVAASSIRPPRRKKRRR